ncbi:MAG TPA: matrixin family metalloprotease, partial [Bryobacteraceae bacterium]|nr:matrixin family metalloprotease [Bryobacteraceae bacterium]
AAKVWNDVESSDLRLAFGGITAAGTGPTFTGQTASSVPNGPGIDIVFTDEIAPGIIAQGGTSSLGSLTNSAAGPFVPVNRSVVMLNRNLSEQPSFSESFFLTLVHELGHALGLQHTLTSSVMSTERTRAATKAKPLSADDIAGVSLLYPTRNFLAQTGSVTGRVTLGGSAVSLASVVAIPVAGSAVSTLTNPDGSYRIDGIPPGPYLVYVHPLPPAAQGVEVTPANIVAPLGPDGRPFEFSVAFDTVFYPGTKEPSQAATVNVAAGGSVDSINFSVQRRTASSISSVQSYGFIGQVTIKPPVINRNEGIGRVVFAGQGLLTNTNSLVAGLSARPLSSAVAPASALRPYPFANGYVELNLSVNAATHEGAHHLLLSAGGDIYILPSAFQVSLRAPPSIATLSNTLDAAGARAVAIAGSGFDRETRYLFDGHPAAVRSFDEFASRVIVTPPPALPGHRAAVVALNSDGQSSLFVQGNNVPAYAYDPAEAPGFTITPSTLPAASEAMVEITGTGLNLIDGLARLGFGSSDIAVRRVWVTGPNRLLANIGISNSATPGAATVTVSNGVETVTLPSAFSIQPANLRQLVVFPAIGPSQLTPGSVTALLVGNLPAGITPAGLTLTLNDQPVVISGVSSTQLTFQIPQSLASGPAVLRLRTATEAAQPVVLNIEPPPPAIVNVQHGGFLADATRPVTRGDAITLVAAGLQFDAFTGNVNAGGITVTVAGVEHVPQQVIASAQRGLFEVTFSLGAAVPSGTLPLAVTQEGRTSNPVALSVR